MNKTIAYDLGSDAGLAQLRADADKQLNEIADKWRARPFWELLSFIRERNNESPATSDSISAMVATAIYNRINETNK